jgi:Arc/MetJ-type ribon-helix-helix transcriptional regulator
VFNRLREIAEDETVKTGDHTSVSDLVRSALSDYITVYESTEKLNAIGNGRR